MSRADWLIGMAIGTAAAATVIHWLRWRRQRGRFEGRMQILRSGANLIAAIVLGLYLAGVVTMAGIAGYLLLGSMIAVTAAGAAESWVNL
jgi:hypothetical protein